MNYFIKRDDKEYGPYTLVTLQQYVTQGNISPSDLARSEGMSEWAPVSTILGNVPVAVAPYGTTSTGFGTVAGPQSSEPPPPSMHWAILLMLANTSRPIAK